MGTKVGPGPVDLQVPVTRDGGVGSVQSSKADLQADYKEQRSSERFKKGLVGAFLCAAVLALLTAFALGEEDVAWFRAELAGTALEAAANNEFESERLKEKVEDDLASQDESLDNTGASAGVILATQAPATPVPATTPIATVEDLAKELEHGSAANNKKPATKKPKLDQNEVRAARVFKACMKREGKVRVCKRRAARFKGKWINSDESNAAFPVLVAEPNEAKKPRGRLKNCNDAVSLDIIKRTGYNPCMQKKAQEAVELSAVNAVIRNNVESVGTTERLSSRCSSPRRVLNILYGKQRGGLLDRTMRIQVFEYIACRLGAELIFKSPCKALGLMHNANGKTECGLPWDSYMRVATYRYVEEDSEFELCPERDAIQTPENESAQLLALERNSLERSWLADTNHNAEKLRWAAQHPNASFAWQWVINDRQDLDHVEALLRSVNVTGDSDLSRDGLWPLPQCDVERVLPVRAAEMAKNITQHSLGRAYLSVRVRRGDDLKVTAPCTDAALIAMQVRSTYDTLVSKGRVSSSIKRFHVYVMMEPEPKYQRELVAAARAVFADQKVQIELLFEQDFAELQRLETEDNYSAFAVSSAIAQAAPLGRIAAHRTPDAHFAVHRDIACVVRYLPRPPFNQALKWYDYDHWRAPLHSFQLFPPTSTNTSFEQFLEIYQ